MDRNRNLRESPRREVRYIGNWAELGRRRAARQELRLTGVPFPAANIGRRHPDYGMTPAEHAFSKANRPRAEVEVLRLQGKHKRGAY